MPSTIKQLTERGLIQPPTFLPDNVHYETIMGSVAYGVSSDTSDMDIYGFCIPPKHMVFPHLNGEIMGFGRQKKRFEQFQQHHIQDQDAMAGKGRDYDVTIYSIVRYFQLCMENNPNMLDSLFTNQTSVLHATQVGNLVRENRKIFLSKKCFHTFKGYAFAQLKKIKTRNPHGKRKAVVEEFGFDVKHAYHLVRLLSQVEQLLLEGDMDLQEKGRREHMKAVRNGDISQNEIEQWFSEKERQLEKLYHESKIPHSPDEPKIKQLLVDCLEMHYGDLSDSIVNPDEAMVALRKIDEIVKKVL